MKMLIISFILLLACIFLWLWFHFTSIEIVTSYFWDNLGDLLDKVGNEDWDEAKNDIEVYSKKWEDTRNLWIYFLNQGNVNNIDSSFKLLNSYISNSDKILSQAEIENLRVLFNIIKDNECLSLENIF
ncbi:MAG: DUF4363 family protein [Tissierellia bacterium]|nr:DUF4363 family protein [Tissierellia bacterium]MDD4780819.1 DUF4363 family protein [Tissierellia bacterium]